MSLRTPTGRTPREFDILAHADGLLDPLRRAEVEEWLQDHPEAARRAALFAAQNDAIRALYEPVATEPLPPRLTALLEDAHAPARPAFLRPFPAAVAAALMLFAAGGAGWWLGSRAVDDSALTAFLDDVSTHDAASRTVQVAAAPPSAQPLNWLADRVALELRRPDLEDLGFSLRETGLVSLDERTVARLVYVDDTGREVALFVAGRWTDETPAVRVREDGSVATAHWTDGPLVYAVSGPAHRTEIKVLAEKVRDSIRLSPQTFDPGGAVSAGGLGEDFPPRLEQVDAAPHGGL